MYWGLKINVSNTLMWSTTHVVNDPLPQSGVCRRVTQGKVNSCYICADSNYRTDL